MRPDSRTGPLPSVTREVLHHRHTEGRVRPLWHSFHELSTAHTLRHAYTDCTFATVHKVACTGSCRLEYVTCWPLSMMSSSMCSHVMHSWLAWAGVVNRHCQSKCTIFSTCTSCACSHRKFFSNEVNEVVLVLGKINAHWWPHYKLYLSEKPYQSGQTLPSTLWWNRIQWCRGEWSGSRD